MKTVTLDFSKVDSGPHKSFIERAVSLGYTIIEGYGISNESLAVPTLHDFIVDKDSSIDSIIKDIPISNQCKKAILAGHFADDYSEGQLRGGFLSLDKYFKSKEAIHAINHLAFKENRKFRPGTALEMIQFWKQKRSVCPKFFSSLAKVWKGIVLGWYGDCAEFEILGFDGEWRPVYKIFIVEDV